MIYLVFETNRFLVLFRALSPEGEEQAAKEILDRLSRSDIANDNAERKERDFLVD